MPTVIFNIENGVEASDCRSRAGDHRLFVAFDVDLDELAGGQLQTVDRQHSDRFAAFAA